MTARSPQPRPCRKAVVAGIYNRRCILAQHPASQSCAVELCLCGAPLPLPQEVMQDLSTVLDAIGAVNRADAPEQLAQARALLRVRGALLPRLMCVVMGICAQCGDGAADAARKSVAPQQEVAA